MACPDGMSWQAIAISILAPISGSLRISSKIAASTKIKGVDSEIK